MRMRLGPRAGGLEHRVHHQGELSGHTIKARQGTPSGAAQSITHTIRGGSEHKAYHQGRLRAQGTPSGVLKDWMPVSQRHLLAQRQCTVRPCTAAPACVHGYEPSKALLEIPVLRRLRKSEARRQPR